MFKRLRKYLFSFWVKYDNEQLGKARKRGSLDIEQLGKARKRGSLDIEQLC